MAKSDQIKERHPLIEAQLENYRRVEDSLDRLRVQAAGLDYLPNAQAAHGQTQVFQTYIDRAEFPELTGRVLSSFLGMAFRNPPTYKLQRLDKKSAGQSGRSFLEDVDLQGNTLEEFAQKVLQAVIKYDWVVLVAAYSDELRRPYASIYKASQAYNWATEAGLCTHIRLEEFDEEMDRETFETKRTERVRVHDLIEGQPYYRLFEKRKVEEKEAWVPVEDWTPYGDGRFDHLPVTPIQTFDCNTWAPSSSSLMPLVNQVFSAYRTSADLELARHQCRIIQPALFGVKKSETDGLIIGDGSWWRFTDSAGNATVIEPSGQACKILADALNEKIAKAAAQGARYLMERKRAAETEETKRIEESGEVNILQAMIRNCSHGIRQFLIDCERWISPAVDEEAIEFSINEELWPEEGFSVEVFDSLVRSWMAGVHPHEVPAQYLMDKGLTEDDPETLLEKVKAERPNLWQDLERSGENQSFAVTNESLTTGGGAANMPEE